jgi:hypothetical protein
MHPYRRRSDQPLIASGASRGQTESALGSSDQHVDVFAVLAGERFVALKSEQASKVRGTFAVFEGAPGLVSLGAFSSHQAAPPTG